MSDINDVSAEVALLVQDALRGFRAAAVREGVDVARLEFEVSGHPRLVCDLACEALSKYGLEAQVLTNRGRVIISADPEKAMDWMFDPKFIVPTPVAFEFMVNLTGLSLVVLNEKEVPVHVFPAGPAATYKLTRRHHSSHKDINLYAEVVTTTNLPPVTPSRWFIVTEDVWSVVRDRTDLLCPANLHRATGHSNCLGFMTRLP